MAQREQKEDKGGFESKKDQKIGAGEQKIGSREGEGSTKSDIGEQGEMGEMDEEEEEVLPGAKPAGAPSGNQKDQGAEKRVTPLKTPEQQVDEKRRKTG